MFGLKRYFLLDSTKTYLNHGSFGATPRPVFKRYQHWQSQLERQPVEFLGRRHPDLMKAARSSLSDYLGTNPDNLVFTTNVTESLNIVARSLELGPGDEILSTDHEYGALDRTWRFLSQQRGFTYINQPIPVPMSTPEAFVNSIFSGVTARTRAIFVSHISSPTAIIFPIELIVQRARKLGILTIVDGAHAPGQIPLDLDGMGVDFYGGNLHKWLCAPKGAGFLYARKQAQPLLKPLVVSWGFEPEQPGPSKYVDLFQWTGTRDIAAYLSTPAAIEFQEKHNWDQVRQACHELAVEAQESICSLTGLTPLSNLDWFRQFVSIPLPEKTDLESLKCKLYEKYSIEIPLIAWNGKKLIRVSVQGYNSRRDIEKLVRALKILL